MSRMNLHINIDTSF